MIIPEGCTYIEGFEAKYSAIDVLRAHLMLPLTVSDLDVVVMAIDLIYQKQGMVL